MRDKEEIQGGTGEEGNIKVPREGINPALRHGQLSVTRVIGIKEGVKVEKCAAHLRWWKNSVIRTKYTHPEKGILLTMVSWCSEVRFDGKTLSQDSS